ncbi:MAG TPA: hypothetical protein VG892_07730 [Terriglobales bacterium]|nr:hypothetical protein [Terriglobales bacterium]
MTKFTHYSDATYLREAQQRIEGGMTPYHSKDYAFAREQTDGIRLENSGPAVEPLWQTIAAGVCLVIFIGFCVAMAVFA